MKFKENVSLAKFSNYKIGGAVRFFFEPKNEREVVWAVREAKKLQLQIFVLGGGTNLLFSDAGFAGLVIKPKLMTLKAASAKAGHKFLEVGAGVSITELIDYSVKHSLSGLEWAGGLPGTLGGAIRGNAGCFGGETKDIVVSVRSFDMKKMKVLERNAKACAFRYRDSIFKQSGAKGGASEIILSAKLALKLGDKKSIARAIREKIEHRMKNHPLEHPNIGSIFKNVPLGSVCRTSGAGGQKKYDKALAAQVIVFRGSQFSIKADPFPVISAAKLIGETGLRGVSFRGAMISAKHPNFIVNVLGAGSEDVKNLMKLAKGEVKRKFGVILEEEVQII